MNSIITLPKSKIRCPYLAIPIPGKRPFVVDRDKYETVIEGINITDTSLDVLQNGIWALTIMHRTGRVKGRYVFYNQLQTQRFQGVVNDIYAWAESQRKKQDKPKLDKFDKQVKRLEKELDKARTFRPHNPLLVSKRDPASEWLRDTHARWREQRGLRVKVARIAGDVLTYKLTDRKAYDAIRAMGLNFKRYSDITQSYKEYYGVPYRDDYWKKLHRFVDGASCTRKSDFDMKHLEFAKRDLELRLKEHGEARVRYCEELRHANSIKAQITSVVALGKGAQAQRSEGAAYAA